MGLDPKLGREAYSLARAESTKQFATFIFDKFKKIYFNLFNTIKCKNIKNTYFLNFPWVEKYFLLS